MGKWDYAFDLARIIHDGSSRNRAVALRDGHAEPRDPRGVLEQSRRGGEQRACQPKARRSSESAIAAEALMNNARLTRRTPGSSRERGISFERDLALIESGDLAFRSGHITTASAIPPSSLCGRCRRLSLCRPGRQRTPDTVFKDGLSQPKGHQKPRKRTHIMKKKTVLDKDEEKQ